MARSGRPRSFDRTAALDAAMHLFWEHGDEATSLSQLKATMGGLSSASFYAAFTSKEALFREALRPYLDTHGQVVASLCDPAALPRDALEKALRGSARMQTDPSHPAGCLVVLSTLTSAPENSHLQALLAAEREPTAPRSPPASVARSSTVIPPSEPTPTRWRRCWRVIPSVSPGRRGTGSRSSSSRRP